jgi:hypothetical protein
VEPLRLQLASILLRTALLHLPRGSDRKAAKAAYKEGEQLRKAKDAEAGKGLSPMFPSRSENPATVTKYIIKIRKEQKRKQ